MLETWVAVEPPSDFADRVLVDTGRRWLPYVIAAASCTVAAAAILLLVFRPEVVVEKPPIAIDTEQPRPGVEMRPVIVDAGIPVIQDAAPLKHEPRVPLETYDLDLEVGMTATIHDSRGETRVNFYSDRCLSGMQIEVARDTKFQPRTANQGSFGVVMPIGTGTWAYRASCMSGGMPDAPFATGRLAVVRDAGKRALPKQIATVEIKADGRNYKVSYQSKVPEITIAKPLGGEVLNFASKGNVQKIDMRRAVGSPYVAMSDLEEGSYTFWFTRGDMVMGKSSTLKIEFDPTAPQVFLDAPEENAVASSQVTVQGMTVPGWIVRFEATPIPTDAQHRFTARVPLRSGFKSVAVRFDHPQRGTHYYVRRLR